MISLSSPVETRAHRWPAAFKLAGLFAATIGLFALQGWGAQACALAAVAALYAAGGRVFLRGGLTRLRPIWPFVLVIGIWHMIAGNPAEGAAIALRMAAAVALANLVTMTTALSEMIEVLRALTAPLRRLGLNTRAGELAIALAIRFTPVLLTKGAALSQAWRARSRRRPGWRIVLPFTILALDDAERVAEALRARGGILPSEES